MTTRGLIRPDLFPRCVCWVLTRCGLPAGGGPAPHRASRMLRVKRGSIRCNRGAARLDGRQCMEYPCHSGLSGSGRFSCGPQHELACTGGGRERELEQRALRARWTSCGSVCVRQERGRPPPPCPWSVREAVATSETCSHEPAQLRAAPSRGGEEPGPRGRPVTTTLRSASGCIGITARSCAVRVACAECPPPFA